MEMEIRSRQEFFAELHRRVEDRRINGGPPVDMCSICWRGFSQRVRAAYLAGRAPKDIAEEIDVSDSTVEGHKRKCMSVEDRRVIYKHSRQRRRNGHKDGHRGPKRKVQKYESDTPSFASAQHEALMLLPLLSAGQTIEKIRADLCVSGSERVELLQSCPPEIVGRYVEFRAAVAKAFDEIVASPELDALMSEIAVRREEVIRIMAAAGEYHKEYQRRIAEAEKQHDEEDEDDEEAEGEEMEMQGAA
jgi:hypothetical protein